WFLLWEKVPLLLLSALASAITIYAQKKGGAVIPLDALPLDARLSNAVVAYAKYIVHMAMPVNLALMYPHPGQWPVAEVVLSGILLILVSLAVWMVSWRFAFLKTGWLWYLLTLLPVIGIVQVGNQAMADRYAYLPFIGLYVIIVWLPGAFIQCRREAPGLYLALGAIIVGLLVPMARHQTSLWRNTETLLTHAIVTVPGNYEAMNNLGAVYIAQGNFGAAIGHLREAVRVKPDYAIAYNNLGQAYVYAGDVKEGIKWLRWGYRLRPDLEKLPRNLASALLIQGENAEAARLLEQLLARYPADADLHNDIGTALARMGHTADARRHFHEALRIRPTHQAARQNLNILATTPGEALDGEK
ncbi:MAG: tetratricopeptide repeat protein, partial [Syntrophales bacterium]|nr:tetratricopeptide repeat protein [Syntrophales bacterium]